MGRYFNRYTSLDRFYYDEGARHRTIVDKALGYLVFMDTSQAKTDGSQNASGERGGYVTPIAISPNGHELSSSRCQSSLTVIASSSSLSFPCDPRLPTASCSSNRWDLSPGCDDGFIPIARDGDDPVMTLDNIRLRSGSFYSRKRKWSGGWNRGRTRGSGKSTVANFDPKEMGKKKMAKGVVSNNNKNNGSRKMSECPFSALEQPNMFYSKAMMMNPWSQLKPVVGCILMPLPWAEEIRRSWLPDSVAVKEHAATCMSAERTMAQLRSRKLEQDSHRSLADCLALSFDEAVNE